MTSKGIEELIPLPTEQQALQPCQLLQMIDSMPLAAWVLLQQWKAEKTRSSSNDSQPIPTQGIQGKNPTKTKQ